MVQARSYEVALNGNALPYTQLGRLDGRMLIVEKEVDMQGRVCKLPKELSLCFKDGMVRNGTLEGNDTEIKGSGVMFDKMTIKGSWKVKNISTQMFADLSYENALHDVVALASPNVQNRITIEKGDYIVKALQNDDKCLKVSDNTTLIVDGNISLTPNGFERYSILYLEGKNIKVYGKGQVIGDKHTHTGKTGEWGMGVELRGAVDATVQGITVKDCWGDCIYVGGESRNVLIEECILDNGRRQGISITSANGVTIRDCLITNVHGTNPQYAIDIEPNRRDYVDNVMVENVTVRDCEGGFFVTRGESLKGLDTPWIGHVVIRDCQVSSKSRVPIRVRRCSNIEIKGCIIGWVRGKTAMSFLDVDKAVVENNIMKPNGGIYEALRQEAKEFLGRDDGQIILLESVRQKRIRNNNLSN